jgi:hypothetical protein
MTSPDPQLIAHLRSLLGDPNADPVAIADCYVELIGPQLRDLARHGLARDGRGVVEINLRGIDLRRATGNVPIAYYPADAGADDWPAELYSSLDSYDPRYETVVLLYQDTTEPLVYVLE